MTAIGSGKPPNEQDDRRESDPFARQTLEQAMRMVEEEARSRREILGAEEEDPGLQAEEDPSA